MLIFIHQAIDRKSNDKQENSWREPTMSKETIYREDAIEAVEELNAISFYELNEHSKEAFTEIRRALKALPSADRPQGEWIDKGDYAECSNCGADSGTQFNGIEPVPRKTKFCPNCGARMKGADNEV